MMEALVLLVLSGLIILSALGVIFLKKPVYSALSLLVNLVATSVLYISVLSAPFLGIIQLIVYVGAIVVFFLFVIMLINLEKEMNVERIFSPRLIFGVVVVVVFAIQLLALGGFVTGVMKVNFVADAGDVADILFTKYALLFELVSVLIFAAAAGAVALAKKKM